MKLLKSIWAKASNHEKLSFEDCNGLLEIIQEPTKDEKVYSLCEAVADIAYIAGTEKYYSEDSRTDIANIIEWAKEFEKLNEGVEWGVNSDKDYIDAITEFAEKKLGDAPTKIAP